MALMDITTVLSGINILLVGFLLYVYVQNYVKMKSGFTMALLLFALLFLVHNVLYLYFALKMMPYYASDLGMFAFIFTLLQTLAFGILSWATWK